MISNDLYLGNGIIEGKRSLVELYLSKEKGISNSAIVSDGSVLDDVVVAVVNNDSSLSNSVLYAPEFQKLEATFFLGDFSMNTLWVLFKNSGDGCFLEEQLRFIGEIDFHCDENPMYVYLPTEFFEHDFFWSGAGEDACICYEPAEGLVEAYGKLAWDTFFC